MKTLGDLIDEGIHAKREAVRVIVTPGCAKRALEFNTGNRYMRKSFVEYLTALIKQGNWRDDHNQGILFSETGRLLDGQHRLNAVVLADRPIIMRVDTGFDEALWQHLDGGIPRAMQDRVNFADDKGLNKEITMILNAYIRIKTQSARKHHPSVVERLFADWSPEIGVIGSFIHANRGKIACQCVFRACTNAAIMEGLRRDENRTRNFLRSMAFPDGDCQPGRVFREWMLRNKMSAGINNEITQYRMAWSALESALEDRDITSLRPLKREVSAIGYPLKLEVK